MMIRHELLKRARLYRSAARLFLLILCVLIVATAGTGETFALTVPEIKINDSSRRYSNVTSAKLSGVITPAAGQKVHLYSNDKRSILETAHTVRGGDGKFSLKVPEELLEGNRTVTLYVKSTAVEDVAASRAIPVTIEYMPQGTTAAPKPTTGPTTAATTTKKATTKATTKKKATTKATTKKKATTKATTKKKATTKAATKKPAAKTFTIVYCGNDGTFGNKQTRFTVAAKTGTYTTISANRFSRQGYEFVGWATNTSRGWLVGGLKNKKAMGKVNLKHFQLGNVAFRSGARVNADKLYSLRKNSIVQLHAVWKGKGPRAAADWACIHAADNSFAYGKHYGLWHGKKGRREHCHGCYYCGTNRRKWNGSYRFKEAEPGSRWEKTYCCNPFICAAYAHGANHSTGCFYANMDYNSWTSQSNSHGRFKKMGRISGSKLQTGDIFFNGGHVWMYAGNGCRVEASIPGWGGNSIAVRDGTARGSASGVIRYVPR